MVIPEQAFFAKQGICTNRTICRMLATDKRAFASLPLSMTLRLCGESA